jgi:hypothetical protein
MALFKRGGVWWYKFYFAGQPIRESSKATSKTVAKNAEQQRRRELETEFHNIREFASIAFDTSGMSSTSIWSAIG